ncbi:lipopolysaccharide kinase InaA family protein [Pectobacterium polonicum]|uniref:Kinase n=1 Tax=Pectobacterium polonicum TaxID=2485124 RepID=A0AAE9SWM5_9GAMM|nr:lipopolysaccharide kinase InaA family protein [Pectobacterium polonicum]MDC9820066.1 lipopolysaccharide kinase InaA family protein [Pectobacterium polonicum]TKY83328.1 kinase [Pectobacterium polonicum]UVO07688.1 kinase [Pectobacterium polonicum]GKW25092.1 kinase [Pectobacterium carotovorum subsp. carotovorum]
MANIISCTTRDGELVQYVDEVIGSGSMKDVYFSPDKTYVVAFYKKPQNEQAKERIAMITGRYRQSIFEQAGGEYWQDLFCWPTSVVEHEGRIGIVVPTYHSHFFFKYGSKNNDFLGIKGREKEGKWFASANNQNKFLDPRERGNLLNYLKVCLLLTRAVRRMHAAGLCHSDLSYKNVLVDPEAGHACVIDIDGLVVPGKYPPDVVGTPDFIAPEVVKTTHLAKEDANRILPSISTDRHALAVLIYMYLFYRHPLRGGKIHDMDDEMRDESLSMGERALFIEHPTDRSNAVKLGQISPSSLPWADTDKIPFTILGPYLTPLFEKAFITGLHEPAKRPTADEWETALVKTVDLIQPCQNSACEQEWYVFSGKTQPSCPYCGTPYKGKLPILNLYSSRKTGSYRPDDHRLMVWNGQSLYAWHVNRLIAPNERTTPEQKKRVGYFVFHNDQWWLVNEGIDELMSLPDKQRVAIGDKLALTDGAQFVLSTQEGGRLVVVQLVSN